MVIFTRCLHQPIKLHSQQIRNLVTFGMLTWVTHPLVFFSTAYFLTPPPSTSTSPSPPRSCTRQPFPKTLPPLHSESSSTFPSSSTIHISPSSPIPSSASDHPHSPPGPDVLPPITLSAPSSTHLLHQPFPLFHILPARPLYLYLRAPPLSLNPHHNLSHTLLHPLLCYPPSRFIL